MMRRRANEEVVGPRFEIVGGHFVTCFPSRIGHLSAWIGDLLPLAQKAHDRGADVPRSARHPYSCRYSTLGCVNGVVNSSLRFRIVRPVMAEVPFARAGSETRWGSNPARRRP